MESNHFKRILLIDDDVFIVQLLSLLLTQSGYDIISASNGKEAMAILAEQPPVELIIVDLMMPKMDGLAFLQWLRQEAKVTIPAFVLTAMVTVDTEKQVMAVGATALFHKPIRVSELLAKIHQFEHTFKH